MKESKRPLLEVKNLNVSYNGLQVLWNVCLKVYEEECVALIGPNGAGKTTLIKTISGLVHPDNGLILFEGRRIERMKPYQIAELGIVQVPEGRKIFTKLTVKENLLMGCFSKSRRKKVHQLLEQVYNLFPWMKERESQEAGTLSGGEQQMLAIARGLMCEPKLLLLDEISLGLAPILINRIYDKIREISNLGIAVLLTDQYATKSLEISSRAYVMESGRITLEGNSVALRGKKEFEKAYFGV